MSNLSIKYLNSLEKVFPNVEPNSSEGEQLLSALWGEDISFQLAYFYEACQSQWITIKIDSPLKDYLRMRKVELVPSRYPSNIKRDEDFLCVTPGMYPDLLKDISDNRIKLIPEQWRSLWFDIKVTEDILPGCYPISIELLDDTGCILHNVNTRIEVIGAKLPLLRLKHTEWFHGDCLADYYAVEVFSEKHWEIMSNFIEAAVCRNCNMILVPMFTPPLDTAVGGERTTIQLVDVEVIEGNYSFHFEKLRRFITICQMKGIRYFEMSHLFTQWGAKAAPKIMATVDGTYKRIFGWDTPSVNSGYEEFLQHYLPCLTEKLKEWSLEDVVYFHVSDEPELAHLEDYKKANEMVVPLLQGFPVLDALSDYDFYQFGLVEQPVCAIDHIEPFLANNTENLWAYYCNGQSVKVSNRLMAMPSYRNRIYGVQTYKYQITGILHWGFNFYNSQYSIEHINPYENTDSSEAFPSGDSFLVYPGKDGRPEESIRIMVLDEALNDYRAMQLLEQLAGRSKVLELIEEGSYMDITFSEYPRSTHYLLQLRDIINQEIKRYTTDSNFIK